MIIKLCISALRCSDFARAQSWRRMKHDMCDFRC